MVAWGRTDQGQCNVPAPNTGFVAIAAGYAHSLALKSDGSVVAWGLDDNNQVSGKPAGIGFKTVAAGFYYSLALKSDGSLVAWGQNDHDQIGVPAGTGFVAVDGGYWHGVALGVPAHTITASADTGGTITPEGTVAVNHGASQILHYHPGCGIPGRRCEGGRRLRGCRDQLHLHQRAGQPHHSGHVQDEQSSPCGRYGYDQPRSGHPGTRSFTATPAGFTDPDGDTLTYHYAWTLNGQEQVGETGATINLTVKSGDVVAVSVTASDGTLSSDAATDSVTVGLFPVTYKPGWNLVAGGPNSNFAGRTLHHYGNATGEYDTLTEVGMQHAFGYWLWLEEALTAYLNVTNPPLTYQVGVGWNLIGQQHGRSFESAGREIPLRL